MKSNAALHSSSTTEPKLTPVQRFGEAIADRVERWMPSPFLFAILLTYVAAIAAIISEGVSVPEIARSWYGGFWSLLQFAMQMVIILVTGCVVAYHPRAEQVSCALSDFLRMAVRQLYWSVLDQC